MSTTGSVPVEPSTPAPFVDFASRRELLMQAVLTSGCGKEAPKSAAALVTDPADIRWLTGLASSNAAMLVGADYAVLVTDSRYEGQAREISGIDVQVDRDVARTAVLSGAKNGATHIDFDATQVSAAQRLQWAQDADLGSLQLHDEPSRTTALRMVKDEVEIETIKKACEISTAALGRLVRSIEIGWSELQIARRLEAEMAIGGADDRAFPTIAAVGPNSANAHHAPTKRRVRRGEILKVDFGALVNGYHADCTRTFLVGDQPTELQLAVHAVVADAAQAGRDALSAGSAITAVDRCARLVIERAGYGERFTHGLGHGIGLAIHEPPLLSAPTDATLAQGNVVTVEPGIYLPSEFGVRIEDTCVVTEGEPLVLTDFPRELTAIAL